MRKSHFYFKTDRAQAATELAVFGAILIFILGLIIRSSLNTSYVQSQTLKAMRLAFKASFDSAYNPFDKNTGDTSRLVASLLFIEDRMSPEFSKYGSLTRIPYIVSASGAFTRNLFKTMDYGVFQELPVFDMFINGKHFTFTLADFREIDLTAAQAPNLSDFNDYPDFPPGARAKARDDYQKRWDCERDPTCNKTGVSGRLIYVISPSTLAVGDNSTTGPDFCPSSTCTNFTKNVLSVDQRFDLNRDGTPDVPAAQRTSFSWQWLAYPATTIFINLQNGKNSSADVDADLHEEQILEMVDSQNRLYTPEKQPEGISATILSKIPFPIKTVRVLDSQAGDIDFTRGSNDPRPRSGLRDDTAIYTKLSDGTHLLIREGKLLNPENYAVVRSEQKRDQVDIIERSVQLSNNTGRFCNHPANPDVEVCVSSNNDCFLQANVDKTCYATDTKILYVRSRIQDRRGRRWITDISEDQTISIKK